VTMDHKGTLDSDTQTSDMRSVTLYWQRLQH